MVWLTYLKHSYDLSDEQVCERWLENPYWQFFCGSPALVVKRRPEQRTRRPDLQHQYPLRQPGPDGLDQHAGAVCRPWSMAEGHEPMLRDRMAVAPSISPDTTAAGGCIVYSVQSNDR